MAKKIAKTTGSRRRDIALAEIHPADAVIVNGIDVTIPEFLRRQDTGAPKPDLKELFGQADWAPFRDYKNQPPAPPAQLFVADPAAPVRVNVRGKDGSPPTELARYASMAEFEAKHDRKTYPVSRTGSFDNETIILVRATPWAGREPKAQGVPRAPRDFSSPDAPGKPVKAASSLGTILRLMIEGRHTMEAIVAASGVEGGVVSAEDKVLHRIRFVLFRQHGVGHIVSPEGIVSAVLPSGFDKEKIFKK